MPLRRLPYRTIAGLPPNPVPSGLVLDVDPTDVGSMSISAGNVQSIVNRVTGVPLTLVGSAITLGLIAGSTAMQFDGSSALFGAEAAVLAALSSGASYTIVAVNQLATTVANQTIIGCGTAAGVTNARRYWGTNSSAKWSQSTVEDSGAATSHLSEMLTDTDPHVFAWRGTGTTSIGSIDLITADPPAEADTPGATTLSRYAIGCYPAHAPTQFQTGLIGITLVWNRALTNDELLAVYDWITTTRTLIAPVLPQPVINPNDLYLLVDNGQSNSSGQGDRPGYVPANLQMWSHVIGVTSPVALVPLGPYSADLHGSELRLAALFGRVGLPLCNFKVSKGTTGLFSYWAPPISGGPHTGWDIFVADWAIALPLFQSAYPGKNIVPIVKYDQCEYEQQNLPSGDPEAVNYGTYLIQWIDATRALPGLANAIIVIIRAHDFPAADATNTALVKSGQDAAALARPDVYVFPSEDYSTYSGALHFNAQGLQGPAHTEDMAYEVANVVLGLLP